MGKHSAVMLFLNGREEEVRLLSAPHRDGFMYATRDGRVVARGATPSEAYQQLARLESPSGQLVSAA